MPRKSSKVRRAQIVDALLTVMADQGYSKATINRIAEEADLTPGLIHYHFKSKQEILLELLQRIIGEQLEAVDRHWTTCKSDWAKVEVFIQLHLQATEPVDPHTVASWVTITAEAIRQPLVGSAFSESIAKLSKRLTTAIESGVASGEFHIKSELSPAAAAAGIMSLIQGYFNLGLTARESIPKGTAAPASLLMARGLLGLD